MSLLSYVKKRHKLAGGLKKKTNIKLCQWVPNRIGRIGRVHSMKLQSLHIVHMALSGSSLRKQIRFPGSRLEIRESGMKAICKMCFICMQEVSHNRIRIIHAC